jgi:DNA-binding NarL/FixJ family response regulator
MTTERNIRLLLVDDHTVFRRGLAEMLSRHEDMEVVGEAATGQQGLARARELRPDVVVMDVSMPELGGVIATGRIVEQIEHAKVLALSMHTGRRFVNEMFRHGAVGYVPKHATPEEVLQAVRVVAGGKTYVSPDVAGGVVDTLTGKAPDAANPEQTLSRREREVLQLLAEGQTTKQVAASLNVSPKTVETHRRNIMDKLDLYSIAELTRYAIREGISPLEA